MCFDAVWSILGSHRTVTKLTIRRGTLSNIDAKINQTLLRYFHDASIFFEGDNTIFEDLFL